MSDKKGSVCKKVFPMEEAAAYKYVVIFSRYRGKLLLSRHKNRVTWETQGGHIEPGETPEQAAKRELWEESGAAEFTLEPVCGYYAEDEASGAAGAVFFAEITRLSQLPESEMKEVGSFSSLPEEVTYPGITPVLFGQVEEKFR